MWKKSREVVEAPLEAGQEAAQPESQLAREEPQPQQDVVLVVVLIVEMPAPPQGSTPAMIDLIIDDPPFDKGK
jgi:hypothetical protein